MVLQKCQYRIVENGDIFNSVLLQSAIPSVVTHRFPITSMYTHLQIKRIILNTVYIILNFSSMNF